VALLDTDVDFKVVKEFVAKVKDRAVGAELTKSLTPVQEAVDRVGRLSKLGQNGAPWPPSSSRTSHPDPTAPLVRSRKRSRSGVEPCELSG
jgi:hypothetical protein